MKPHSFARHAPVKCSIGDIALNSSSKRLLEQREHQETGCPVPLSEAFSLGRYQYRQVYRSNEFAIYSQALAGVSPVAFELVRIRVEPKKQIHGKSYPRREVYPNAEAWGSDAWTLHSKADAIAKLRTVRRRVIKRKKAATTGESRKAATTQLRKAATTHG